MSAQFSKNCLSYPILWPNISQGPITYEDLKKKEKKYIYMMSILVDFTVLQKKKLLTCFTFLLYSNAIYHRVVLLSSLF